MTLVATLLALTFPAISRAGCGGTETVRPANHPSGQAAPLALGDSTMLLSLPGLAAEGYDANAHGCREVYQALDMVRQLKAQGTLPHMVVIALGANGSVTQSDITDALGLLCCNRLLVLVTARESGGGSGPDAAIEREQARERPGRILLLDWVKYSQGHGNWFQPDGLHLTWPGVYAFTRLLARALPYAYSPCPPLVAKHRRRVARAGHASINERRSRSSAAPPPLAVRTTLADIGYVGATITGPAGASVQLSEQLAAGTAPIQVVQLPPSGAATVPRALTWLCNPRVRSLVAATLPPAVPAMATSTVETPSCSRRLVTAIGQRARVGHTIAIRLRDRWAIGGLPLTICITPPGGRRGCTPWPLRQGQIRRVVQIPTPRPGGWQTTVQTPYSARKRTIVWVSRPTARIRLLAAGDSEMQILDDFVAQNLGRHKVSVTNDARISTGLTNSFFFNWPSHASRQAPALRPDVTVMFMGANDGFSVTGPNGHPVGCCSPAWSAGYANLVAQMMRIYLRGDAGRVYWFLLPAPHPANFQSLFNAVNAGIRAAAARFPGRVSLIDANAFFTPGNRYRDYMVYHGHGFVIHESDGVHLSTASDTIEARIVTQRLLADRVIR
jgi:lysophospholipase L1-like esterase